MRLVATVLRVLTGAAVVGAGGGRVRDQWRAFLAVLGVTLLLSGCSSYQFLYNQADRLLQDWLEDHVELDQQQRRRLAQQLDLLHRQHRAQQLPKYRQWLLEVRQAVAAEQVSAEHLKGWLVLVEQEGLRLRMLSWSLLEPLLLSLDVSQRQQLLRSLRNRLQDKQSAHEARNAKQRLEYRVERARKQLEYWLGELSLDQQQQLDQLLAKQPQARSRWLDYRRRWLDVFETALLAGDRMRLEQLIVDPDYLRSSAGRQKILDSRQNWLAFIELLLKGLSVSQRDQLLERLDRLIDDIDELTRR